MPSTSSVRSRCIRTVTGSPVGEVPMNTTQSAVPQSRHGCSSSANRFATRQDASAHLRPLGLVRALYAIKLPLERGELVVEACKRVLGAFFLAGLLGKRSLQRCHLRSQGGHVAALVLPDQFQPVGRNAEGAGVGLHHLALLIQHFDGTGAQRVQGSAGDAAGQLHHHGLPGQAADALRGNSKAAVLHGVFSCSNHGWFLPYPMLM